MVLSHPPLLSLSLSSSHLVSILLCEGDGRQFVVLLHQVLVGEKVKGTFLMRLDGILIHVIEISQYYNIGRSKIIQNHTIGVLLNSSIKVHVHVHVCLVMHIMYSTCRVVCDLFQLQLTSDLTPIFADGSPSFVVPTSAIIP